MATILVVDDRPGNRRLLATVLGERGHVVIEAGDGAQGLAMTRDQLPDLVITDILMPVMDGYEMVRELRRDPLLASTRVIFHSANYLQDEVRRLAATSGVNYVLEKSGDPHLVISVVEEALATDAPGPAPGPDEEVPREHLRALSAKLAQRVLELETTELALRQSERRFRSLIESSPVGVFSMTLDGTPTYSNARLDEICGNAGSVEGAPSWIDRVHPDDLAAIVPGTGEGGRSPAPYRRQVRIVRSAGEERWADVQAAPCLDDQDVATAYVGTVEDVTEVVGAREAQELFEARRHASDRLESLGQLAGGIAHDFNNFLALILNYAQFVTDGVGELIASSGKSAQLEEMLGDAGEITNTAHRAAELTGQLLIFARGVVVHPETVDLNALVANLEKPLSATIGEQLTRTTSLDPTVWKVRADPASLEQVLMNLVTNARDAITDSGTVAVSTKNVVIDEQVAAAHALPPGRYITLAVSDSGEGMAPDVAARAFEPFFTTKPKGRGTGLGLWTVYGIVTQLGGRVLIYSEPGHGTTVRVYLPATQSAGGAIADAAAPPPGQGQGILLVQDEEKLRATTARILARNGYSVVSAAEGEAAMAVVGDAGAGIDLVLTDVVMPGTSGRELAARIARVRPALPVLFMSGHPDGLVTPNGPPDEGISLLETPFTRASLLHAVAEALNH
ncbi:MAG: response regulator [Actinobacteria bacterium]|nr:MAG: response regulator [Actinomycetota bacterium]